MRLYKYNTNILAFSIVWIIVVFLNRTTKWGCAKGKKMDDKRKDEENGKRRGETENIWSTVGTTGAIRCSRVLERWTQENDGALTCASGVSWYSKGSVLTPLGEGKGSGGRHMSTHGTTVTTWQCVVECLPSLSEYTNVRECTNGGYPSETRCNPNPPLGSCHRTLS